MKFWLWFLPNGISILLPKGGHQPTLLPKGSHQPTLLPKGGHGLVCYERSVISYMMGPLLGSPSWGHWGPLTPQKWSQCPYRSPQWPHPSQCSWCSLLPQWALSLLPAVRGLGVPQEHPLVNGLPAVGSSVGAASSMGELVDTGLVLSGAVSSDCVVRDSSGRAMPPKTVSSAKET